MRELRRAMASKPKSEKTKGMYSGNIHFGVLEMCALGGTQAETNVWEINSCCLDV